MMDWTDKHCRYFHRVLSQDSLLYTEMITTGALLYGDVARLLNFNEQEHPIALQLGGNNPIDLARSCELAQSHGFDEVNLNCGCPSDRVQNGAFGAILMRSPDVVAQAVASMQASCDIDVTVKCRIGVDDQDEHSDLQRFVESVASAGCSTFIVHARKAWLKGLNPKENRSIPPLNYERVFQLKHDFPELQIVINGGIHSMNQCKKLLQQVDGVMVGREAYHNPWLLSSVDSELFSKKPSTNTPLSVIDKMLPYIDEQIASGERLQNITRHMLGLFQGKPGTKQFKRYLSEHAYKKGATSQVLIDACGHFESLAQDTLNIVLNPTEHSL